MRELIEIQSKLKAPKNQYNLFGKYKYRSCEDILKKLKPLLRKHECLLTISDEMIEVGGRVYVKATATLSNAENFKITVTAFAREAESRKGMNDDQLTGATSSYARKYALNGLFCIDDASDSDATNKHDEGGNEPTNAAIDEQTDIMTPAQKKKIWGMAIGRWGGKPKGEKLTKEEMASVKNHLDNMCVGPGWDLNKLTNQQADMLISTLNSMKGDDIPF